MQEIASSSEDQVRKRRRVVDIAAVVADRRMETADAATLEFFTANRRLDFEAGQFLSIDPRQFPALDRWTRYLEDIKGTREPPRMYSLSSAPGDEILSITVKEERYISGKTLYPPLLSPLLVHHLTPGARVQMKGFMGGFVLTDQIVQRSSRLLHLCAGSGIVPNFSIIREALRKEPLRHILIYANRGWDDVIFLNQLTELAAAHPDRLEIIHLLEQADPQRGTCREGLISKKLIAEFLGDVATVDVFICGPGITRFDRQRARKRGEEPSPSFREISKEALLQLGLEPVRVHTETFH